MPNITFELVGVSLNVQTMVRLKGKWECLHTGHCHNLVVVLVLINNLPLGRVDYLLGTAARKTKSEIGKLRW